MGAQVWAGTEGRGVDPLVVPAAGVLEIAAAGHRLEMARDVEDVAEITAECALEVLGASSAALCRIAQDTCRVLAAAPPSRDVREVLWAPGGAGALVSAVLRTQAVQTGQEDSPLAWVPADGGDPLALELPGRWLRWGAR